MASIALLIVRLTLGLSFIGHGAQKLIGWFGGAGFAATARGYEERMGMRPGSFYAALAGGGEFLGGLLIALGLLTPLGALLIAASIAVAIAKVTDKNGYWLTLRRGRVLRLRMRRPATLTPEGGIPAYFVACPSCRILSAAL
jgi:putative oxidoreductase